VDHAPAAIPLVGVPPADRAPADQAKLDEQVKEYRALVTDLLRQRGAWQLVDSVAAITDPSALADTAGYASYLTPAQKIELLGTADVSTRLEKLLVWTREHLAELDVAETIRRDVQEGMDRQQREFLLRRQLEAVRKELAELNGSGSGGADGEGGSEPADYRARVEAADLPEKVRTAALKEVDKLERTSDSSPEGGWIRTWLDTVLDLPWNVRVEDSYDITAARAVLDADHSGLDDVKDRIIEHLAVRKRRADAGLGVVGGRRGGAVLALAGPPGVGKTSLGESIARAMGRSFVRVALGGGDLFSMRKRIGLCKNKGKSKLLKKKAFQSKKSKVNHKSHRFKLKHSKRNLLQCIQSYNSIYHPHNGLIYEVLSFKVRKSSTTTSFTLYNCSW